MPGGLQIPGRIGHRFGRRDLGRDLGLLLIIVDQVDKGLDQVVVDLPEAVRGQTQKVQASGGTAIRCSL